MGRPLTTALMVAPDGLRGVRGKIEDEVRDNVEEG
jgi:hypothetical protein